MEISISNSPGAAVAKAVLNQGESISTEGGAMISMTPSFDIQTTTHKRDKGSILQAIKRVLTGESIFFNHYTAKQDGSELLLGSVLPGDMLHLKLNNQKIIVQGGSFVAASSSITLDPKFLGVGQALFSGESIFWINLSGSGDLILDSFGAIYKIEVEDECIVDTGHIVAFTDGLNFDISKAGKSWISSMLGSEGFICKFKGQGTIWCQSHSPKSFGSSIGPLLRPR